MNNVLNNKKFKLSHVLGETVVMDECSLNVTSKLKIIERLMIGCREQPSDKAVIEMKRLDSYLNESNSYYTFRVTNWSDNEKCKFLRTFYLFKMSPDIKQQIHQECITTPDMG